MKIIEKSPYNSQMRTAGFLRGLSVVAQSNSILDVHQGDT